MTAKTKAGTKPRMNYANDVGNLSALTANAAEYIYAQGAPYPPFLRSMFWWMHRQQVENRQELWGRIAARLTVALPADEERQVTDQLQGKEVRLLDGLAEDSEWPALDPDKSEIMSIEQQQAARIAELEADLAAAKKPTTMEKA